MFKRAELELLVRKKDIKTIRHLPRKLVKEFFDINPNEAFQLIHSMELLKATRRVIKNNTPENVRDYEQLFYDVQKEREDKKKKVASLSPRWESRRQQKRRHILEKYKLGALADKICELGIITLSSPQKRRAASAKSSPQSSLKIKKLSL